MRLIVLDTNVIVSAGISRGGAPATLIMDWVLEGQVQVVTCPWIVEEYREVLDRPKFRAFGFPPVWVNFVLEQSLHLPNPARWPHSVPDPGDAPFLALAHSSGAWLITGNIKHFPASGRHGVTVLAPADYLARLRAGS